MRYSGEELELVYQNQDRSGNQLYVWKGKSLRDYPEDIADNDAVFYIQAPQPYRFTLKDQLAIEGLVLGIVVRSERRKEKAQLFIDEATKHIL